ncbi:F-box containing protein [Noumeavirus]|uniref:F-box containing protein n=1 Tax=Noumeavirus TaxID=1955558 RepID=UPI000982D9ED|nr:F-box containing protein [Noumeavirus]AQM73360.1 F-box containing protein [Noumeavirus]
MERLPNEIVLHVLSFCEARDVCSFSGTTKEYFLLAKDERLWRQLCEKRAFPKRKKCDSWREWFVRMTKRKPVAYTIEWKFSTNKTKRERDFGGKRRHHQGTPL